ncbi:MAG: Fic family protein [Gammaproteobacteria bacterium]|nr:Fic family protein [Gammaproteobacteria bacterium]
MRPAQDHHWQMPPDRGKALMLAQRALSELVCDAVNLEGIPFTLPEIQTLLDGVSVGGHRLSDQQVALNQAAAWRFLFASLKADQFSLEPAFACQLHALAAKEEALSWGSFRQGSVTIAGSAYLPPPADQLERLYQQLIDELAGIDDIYDRAIKLFLQMARIQFFYDVNKRMGRFMMNGILLSAGYPAINLPARRQLEFNQLMLDFYASNNEAPMNRFMRDCLDPRLIRIMQE